MRAQNNEINSRKKLLVFFIVIAGIAIAFEPELLGFLFIFFHNKENKLTTGFPINITEGGNQILFPCAKLNLGALVNEWKVAPSTLSNRSFTQEKICEDTHQNHWADVLNLINYRFDGIRFKFKNRWQALQEHENYFKWPAETRDRIEAKIMKELVDSSNTASGQYKKEGLRVSQSAEKAKQKYEIAFKNVVAWAARNEPITLKKILQLHQLLSSNTIDSGQLRTVDGGFELVNFASHTLLPSSLENLILYLNHPPRGQHPLEVALIAHQIFIALHPVTEANGRLIMLIINWHLMAHGFPPIAYTFNFMRGLTVFTSLTANGINRFKEITAGNHEQWGLTVRNVSPGMFAAVFRKHNIESTWGIDAQGIQVQQNYANYQRDFGLYLLETITTRMEDTYKSVVSNLEESISQYHI